MYLIRYCIKRQNGSFVAGPFASIDIANYYLLKYYTNSRFGKCHVEECTYLAPESR